MPKKPSITIRLGASHDIVDVDGYEFDRSAMKGPEKRKLRRMTVEALKSVGYFGKRK